MPERELRAIEAVVSAYPEGIAIQGIREALEGVSAPRTLQYRLKHLVDEGRLVREGTRRWARYLPPAGEREGQALGVPEEEPADKVPLSRPGAEILEYVCKPTHFRKPVGYERAFLDAYRPNDTAYLSREERAHLREVGTLSTVELPAGTLIKYVLNRLLIDLSWNSSRLEGNTYSLLDTKRLIGFGAEAQGKTPLEAQMILNHKDAIEFLVGSAGEIGIDRRTILTLHSLLAANLLADAQAIGRLRWMIVEIEKSVFYPLAVPQLIEECFDQILATADAITDPFEQAFFLMVQLPYLQPFEDVNKRVSRLAANIPLIKSNLAPLSFTEVPAKTYTQAILGVYELNKVDLLKDVFIWAYERSASRYAPVRQTLGEPDPFRLKHHAALRDIIQGIVLDRLGRKATLARIAAWAVKNIEADERDQFREVVESEILGLHEGNFARYRVRPSQFEAWQDVWHGEATSGRGHGFQGD